MARELSDFLACMDGQWRVDRYELTNDERVRVVYRSLLDPTMEWSHTPFNPDIPALPKVGSVGRIGFVSIVPVEDEI